MWTPGLLLLPLLLLGALAPFGAQGMPRRKYLCPADFVRHGNSCYYFSVHMATWFDAHFACKDRKSELAILDKGWEDRNMRTYLNKPELARLERWIGGIYNWETKRWVWGANGGHPLKYQGFSKMAKDSDPKWNCIIMDPSMNYKWTSRVCLDKKHYICEVPLKRLKPPQPHVAQPQKPRKNPKDPNKPKKPRDPAKRPRDPNKKQHDPNRPRDPNRRQKQQRQGWRQRQHLRQQQRANAKQQTTTAAPANNQPASQTQYQPRPGYHQTWAGQHRYRFLQIQPDLLPYREEVLI
ncbi:Putative CTL6 [Gryllus bimaculatus]|nr:Putative CTL6 [Gryllus bimaculatus]